MKLTCRSGYLTRDHMVPSSSEIILKRCRIRCRPWDSSPAMSHGWKFHLWCGWQVVPTIRDPFYALTPKFGFWYVVRILETTSDFDQYSSVNDTVSFHKKSSCIAEYNHNGVWILRDVGLKGEAACLTLRHPWIICFWKQVKIYFQESSLMYWQRTSKALSAVELKHIDGMWHKHSHRGGARRSRTHTHTPLF